MRTAEVDRQSAACVSEIILPLGLFFLFFFLLLLLMLMGSPFALLLVIQS